MQPSSEEGTLLLMDGTLFPVVNQLGNLPGLAAMKFDEFATGFGLDGTCVSMLAITVRAICSLASSCDLQIAWSFCKHLLVRFNALDHLLKVLSSSTLLLVQTLQTKCSKVNFAWSSK